MGIASQASVVVPTCERPAALARCLAALRRQTIPVELIAVHDAAADDERTAAVCREAGALMLRTPHAGPSTARNAGASQARHPFLLLTDDDCEPCPDWAEKLVAALEAGADAVAGAVANPSPQEPLGTATQAIHDHLMETPGARFATANNVGCRREVIDAVPFDESYADGGEDRDWCLRVAKAGFEITPVPDAVVLHRQEMTLRSFLRKHAAYGRGSAHFRDRHGRRRERIGWYASLMRRGFRHGARAGVLVGVAQAAGAYGAARASIRRSGSG